MLFQVWLVSCAPYVAAGLAAWLFGFYVSPKIEPGLQMKEDGLGHAAIGGIVGWIAFEWAKSSLLSFFKTAEANGTREVADFAEQAMVQLREASGVQAYCIAAIVTLFALGRIISKRKRMADRASQSGADNRSAAQGD